MEPKTILEVVVGSTVHGIAVKDGLEDLDLMAIVIEGKQQFIGFSEKDSWVKRDKPAGVRSEAGDTDYIAYGLKKYLGLALKGNPSILLALFVPESHIRIITDEGHALRGMAGDIVSKAVYEPFRGYMNKQHERLIGLRGQRNVTRPELVERYGYDTKYAAHIIRLGLQGEEILRTGRISLPMSHADREWLLKVRMGGFSLVQISEQIQASEKMLNVAYSISPLPLNPNREKVEGWMINTYLNHWQIKGGE